MQKFKSTAIRGIQFHNQRERESETNPDIEKDKSFMNYDLFQPGKIDYVETVNSRIEEGVDSDRKIRKDAIRLCEFLITSDKEFFEGMSEDVEKSFFLQGYEFLKDRYGEENIVYATVHKDERTPHLHVGFVPITDDNRLSAKDLFKRQDLVQLQDDFNKHMNDAGFELDRGVSSSRKHLDTAKFKAETLHQSVTKLESQKDTAATKVKNINSEILSKTYELGQRTKELEKIESDHEKQSAALQKIQKEVQEIKVPLDALHSIDRKKILGHVTLKEKDFENIINLAKRSLAKDEEKSALQQENKNLKKDLIAYKAGKERESSLSDRYFKESVKLKRENKELMKERDKFKKLYNYAIQLLQKLNVGQKVMDMFKDKEKEIERQQKQHEQEIER